MSRVGVGETVLIRDAALLTPGDRKPPFLCDAPDPMPRPSLIHWQTISIHDPRSSLNASVPTYYPLVVHGRDISRIKSHPPKGILYNTALSHFPPLLSLLYQIDVRVLTHGIHRGKIVENISKKRLSEVL